jgi:hypothetical protein
MVCKMRHQASGRISESDVEVGESAGDRMGRSTGLVPLLTTNRELTCGDSKVVVNVLTGFPRTV